MPPDNAKKPSLNGVELELSTEDLPPHIDPDSDSALWWAWKKHKQAKRNSNLINWEGGCKKDLELTLGDGQHLTKHSEFHYSFMLRGERVDYWPSTNRWRWQRKTYFGNYKSLKGFVQKRVIR